MWQFLQFLIYNSLCKWFFYGVIGLLAGLLLFYSNHLRKDNMKMKQEIFYLKKQLQVCQRANAELTQQIQLQHEKYERKINELLKKANKPPKVIEIPKIIEKPVYISTKDCQKMAIMIDEFIKIQKEKKK